jgi:hypothetical protein
MKFRERLPGYTVLFGGRVDFAGFCVIYYSVVEALKNQIIIFKKL